MRFPGMGLGLALAASAIGAVCVVVVTIGCGGGGGGTPQNTVLFTKTADLSTLGGEIADPARGIKLIVQPGTLQSSASVTLQVLEKQRDGAAPPGFTASPNGVNIAVDPAAMAAGSAVQVEIPCALPYDEFGSMMFAVDGAGACVPLDVAYDSARKVLVGAAPKECLATLATTKSRAAPPVFGFFWAVVGQATSAASGEFYVWQNGGWAPAGARTMAGKRVAVVVHGMNVGYHTDMADLARILEGMPRSSGSTEKAYEQVWAFKYNWGARIDDSGSLFADKLSAAISGAAAVDVFGHSMGGLVARWALEKRGIGSSVHRLVTLGTPHSGVPSRARPALQLLLFTLCPALGVSAGSLVPGVLDLVQTDVPTSFLRRLNDGDSPQRSTAQYFTLAGDAWQNYKVLGASFGKLMESIYSPGAHTMEHDGIVPLDSALYEGLSRKSQAWADDRAGHTARVHVTHDELNGDPDSAKQKVVADALARWIVDASGGTPLYTVVDLDPAGFHGSLAYAICGNRQGGHAYPTPPGRPHALLWSGSAAAFVDLHPTDAEQSFVFGVSGAREVGYCTKYGHVHAMLWSGSAASAVDLNPPGYSDSEARATNGVQQVGYGISPGDSMHALLWQGSAASAVDLNPPGYVSSLANATDGVRQVGQGLDSQAYSRALLWSGSASTAVELSPPSGYGRCFASGIAGNQQVGGGYTLKGDRWYLGHALLWRGSASSVVELRSAGFECSEASGTNGVQQVGWGRVSGSDQYHALLWSGSGASVVDLHQTLPAAYTSSYAHAIAADGRVVGDAWTGSASHAIMWVPTSRSRSPQPAQPGRVSAGQPLQSQRPTVQGDRRR